MEITRETDYAIRCVGRVAGEYDATSFMNKRRKISILFLLIWVVIVAGLGLVISVRNYL